MVVKVKGRKSFNSSGVWEVEETSQSEDVNTSKSVATPKPEKQGKTPQKTSFSSSKRKGQGNNDESTPAKRNFQEENLKKSPLQKSQTPAAAAAATNVAQNKSIEKKTFHTWTSGELLNLVVRVEDNCQDLLQENYSTAVEKVNWSKISFGERSPNDCKTMWETLFTKARTNRELVEEIREYLLKRPLVTIGSDENVDGKEGSKSQNEGSEEETEGSEEEKDGSEEEKEEGSEEGEDAEVVEEEEDEEEEDADGDGDDDDDDEDDDDEEEEEEGGEESDE